LPMVNGTADIARMGVPAMERRGGAVCVSLSSLMISATRIAEVAPAASSCTQRLKSPPNWWRLSTSTRVRSSLFGDLAHALVSLPL
jgi:hypothetical protein